MANRTESDEDTHLIQALTRLLRPLVRFLLARGFTYTRLIQIIRPLYVSIAEQQYSKSDQVLSDSRISVLTGLARRYVKDLRQSPLPGDPATLKSSPSTRIIAEWVTNPQFLDEKGAPRKLSRMQGDTDAPGFETLANIASNDVRPRTLLDDLIDRGMVQLTPEGMLELLSHAYKPDKHTNELIDYFGQHMHDHFAAATNNLKDDSTPFFERSAFQDRLTAESLQLLQEFTNDRAMEMLKEVYAKAAKLAENDQQSAENTFRFRIGAYCYAEDECLEDQKE